MKLKRHDDFVEHAAELLSPLGTVRTRAMFGGHGIYVDEVFMAIIAGDTLWFKVDNGNRADYEALGYGPFKPFGDQAMTMSYHEVPAEVFDDRLAIVEWGRKAIEAALRGKPKAKPKTKTKAARDRQRP